MHWIAKYSAKRKSYYYWQQKTTLDHIFGLCQSGNCTLTLFSLLYSFHLLLILVPLPNTTPSPIIIIQILYGVFTKSFRLTRYQPTQRILATNNYDDPFVAFAYNGELLAQPRKRFTDRCTKHIF